jgi:hypothetical protein
MKSITAVGFDMDYTLAQARARCAQQASRACSPASLVHAFTFIHPALV